MALFASKQTGNSRWDFGFWELALRFWEGLSKQPVYGCSQFIWCRTKLCTTDSTNLSRKSWQQPTSFFTASALMRKLNEGHPDFQRAAWWNQDGRLHVTSRQQVPWWTASRRGSAASVTSFYTFIVKSFLIAIHSFIHSLLACWDSKIFGALGLEQNFWPTARPIGNQLPNPKTRYQGKRPTVWPYLYLWVCCSEVGENKGDNELPFFYNTNSSNWLVEMWW